MSGAFLALMLGTQVLDVHKGAVLPEGRVIVIAVPLAALAYYLIFIRRHRDR